MRERQSHVSEAEDEIKGQHLPLDPKLFSQGHATLTLSLQRIEQRSEKYLAYVVCFFLLNEVNNIISKKEANYDCLYSSSSSDTNFLMFYSRIAHIDLHCTFNCCIHCNLHANFTEWFMEKVLICWMN